MYAVALAMVPYFKYAKYTGWIRSEYRFLQSISSNPAPLFFAARLISAAAGTASVWVIHRIAWRVFDRTTAIVAAAFLALAYLHVRDSHFGVTDVSAALFVLLALLACVSFAESGNIADLIRAGVMTGVATATKYNAALIALPILWTIVSDPTHRSARDIIKRAALLTAVAATAFLLLAPYTVIEFTAFIRSLNSISSHLAGGHGPNVGRGWWVHLTSSLRHGVGTPELIAGVAGLAWAIWKSPRIGIMLALFPLATFIAIGGGLTVFARYALPIVPFLSLGAAYATTEAVRALTAWVRRPQWQPALVWLTALVVIAPSAVSVWQFDRLLAVEDSRVLAARWIKGHFPNGATIGETERRWNRLSFGGDGALPAKYDAMVLTPLTADPDVIVVAMSPLQPAGLPSEMTPERLSRYTAAMETSSPERPGSTYDWQDEFYVPLAGMSHLDRPGPRITVLTRR